MTDVKAPPGDVTVAPSAEPSLNRGLSARRISMLAIGGAIGTGLFLGSALAVSLTGPMVLVAYLFGSVIALVLVFAATEMAAAHPQANGFGALAHQYLGS